MMVSRDVLELALHTHIESAPKHIFRVRQVDIKFMAILRVIGLGTRALSGLSGDQLMVFCQDKA
jgi:hypothetical protein